MKFTDRGLQALKPQVDRYIAWKDNGDGLGLRVSPKARKSFVYMYRFDGKARMLTLGEYGTGLNQLTLATAQKAHGEAIEKLSNGIDPGADAVTERQNAREAKTVAELADVYLERYAKVKKRSWREDKRILDHDVLPHWRNRKARQICRGDVLDLLDGIADRGSPVQANRTLAVIRKMFNFGLERDIVETTPCAAVKASSVEKSRDRVLTAGEIRILWRALDTGENNAARLQMEAATRLALKMMLLTAQRKGEVVAAEWREFDLGADIWAIPAEKAKNGRSHRVALSPQALAVLVQLKALVGDSPFLFPGRARGKAVTPEALRTDVGRARNVIGIEHWTPHDLRRTAATLMSESGSPRLVVAKVLNHVSADAGVTAVYDRHSYDSEKRQALDGLGRRIDASVSGGDQRNVAELRRA